MLKILQTRYHQKYRTYPFPPKQPVLNERFRGYPEITDTCPGDCRACIDACPTGALEKNGNNLSIDLGKCIFCTECTDICSRNIVRFTAQYQLAARTRENLIVDGNTKKYASPLEEKRRKLLGHSLKLRQVSAGGCNACEADINVLNTLTFDLGRFGIQFVASPRHADGLLITGPVTKNMELALKKTYDAVPYPKVVIAVGACAISGGLFTGHDEVNNGMSGLLPVDLFIPGCPPNPYTILDGLLRLLGRIK